MNLRNKNHIWKYAAVVGLLIFLFIFKIFSPIESIVRRVINPVLKPLYSFTAKLSSKFNAQANRQDLSQQVKSLADERNGLIEDNVRLQMLEEENSVLREQLGFLTRNNHRYVVSNVISRGDLTDDSQISETVIIDKGSDDGLYDGLSVVSGNGVVVGKVVETKNNIAKVCLTNNANCKIAASILSREKTNGIIEGELGLTMKMDFIPQTVKIEKGDSVITSGLEDNIPRGLIIGKVAEVRSESNEAWQSAVVEPLINPDDLIIVSVLLP